jgi:glycosyltransferase involved in cell wall biosynthesis
VKILVLNFNQKGIGTYRRSFYFARELARREHDVTMITVARGRTFQPRTRYKRQWVGDCEAPDGPGPWVRVIEGPGVGYRLLPGWGSGPVDIFTRIAEMARKRYDAVYAFEHHPNVSWPVYATRPWQGYRLVSDWCDWFAGGSNWFRGLRVMHRIDRFLEDRIRLVADAVSVTSVALRDRAIALGIDAERVVQIPEGAATDYVQMLPQSEARARLGLPADVPIVGAMRSGSMHREVRVLHQVVRQVPGSIGLFMGRSPAGAMELAEDLGIAGNLVWTGWVSDEDFPWYLAAPDVHYCPLHDTVVDRARWPAKVLDFLSAGRATVTNPVGEVESLLRRHQVGLLVGESEEEMAAGIVALIQDDARRATLGANARIVMETEWDWHLRGDSIGRLVEQ